MATSPTDIFQTMLSGIQSGKRIAQGNVQNQQRQQQLDLEKQQEQRANQQADSEFHQHMIELGAQPIVNGMVKEDQPLPDLSALVPAGGSDASAGAPKTVSIVRKADPGNTVKWKDATGDQVAYELPSVGSQVWRQNMAARAKAQNDIQNSLIAPTAMAQANAATATAPAVAQGQNALRQAQINQRGIPVPDDVADTIGYPRGYKILPEEMIGAREASDKIKKERLLTTTPGQTVRDITKMGQPQAGATPGSASGTPSTDPSVVATGGPPLPTDDFGKYWLSAYAKKIGKTVPDPNGPAKPTDMDAADMGRALQEFNADKKNPQLTALALQMAQLHIDTLRQQMAGGPQYEIKPGSAEDRAADQLSTGKLKWSQFNQLYSSRNPGAAAKKQAIYDAAQAKNPNFNPAMFEMGAKFAENPKVQSQMASLSNVIRAVPDLIQASDAAARTGVPALNRFIIPGGIQIGGQKYANLHAAQLAFADELSGALGYGSATDMSREMGLKMTDPTLSPQVFKSNINDIVVPFINRKRQSMLDQMGPMGLPGMNPAADQAVKESSGQLPKGNGKTIDKDTASKFYEAAGRDPAKARDLAKQNGWKTQ